jgi:hypothetical protein
VDLYRIPQGDASVDEHLEVAAEADAIVAVEWAEYLRPATLPEDRLEIEWLPADTGRRCRITAAGRRGLAALAALIDFSPDGSGTCREAAAARPAPAFGGNHANSRTEIRRHLGQGPGADAPGPQTGPGRPCRRL